MRNIDSEQLNEMLIVKKGFKCASKVFSDTDALSNQTCSRECKAPNRMHGKQKVHSRCPQRQWITVGCSSSGRGC